MEKVQKDVEQQAKVTETKISNVAAAVTKAQLCIAELDNKMQRSGGSDGRDGGIPGRN